MNDGSATDAAEFDRRLRSLEAENRALRRWVLLSVVGLVIAFAALARWVVVRSERPRFKSVEAEHFVVRDSLNQVRGELGMFYNIVRLALGPDDRNTRGIAIGLGPTVRPQLFLRSAEGGPSLSLSSTSIEYSKRFESPPSAHIELNRHGPGVVVLDSAYHPVLPDPLRRPR